MIRKLFFVVIPVALVAIACCSFGANTASAHSPAGHANVTSVGYHGSGCYHGSYHSSYCAPSYIQYSTPCVTYDDCYTAYPIYMPSYRFRGCGF